MVSEHTNLYFYREFMALGSGGYKLVKIPNDDISKPAMQWPAPTLPPELLEDLLKPKNYEVRLYALKYSHRISKLKIVNSDVGQPILLE